MSIDVSTPAAGAPNRAPHWPLLRLVGGGLLLFLLAAWTIHLWPQWMHDPDLSHGLVTPLVFALLVHEARAHGRRRFLPDRLWVTAGSIVLLLLAVAMLAVAGLFAAALEWSHSLVEFCLALALCAGLAGAWSVYAHRRVAWVPFNWPAAVAIALWLLSSPIPPGTYSRLTQGLQSFVAESVLFSLNLLGLAAVRIGNVIQLPHVSVGVEEACSGIRSLVSCVAAALFLSAVLIHRPWQRALLLLAAPPLAIGMNFLRSLGLTLLAHRGVDISGAWHDITGFLILAATSAILVGLALVLKRLSRPKQPRPLVETPSIPGGFLRLEAALAGFLLVGAATVGFFWVRTRSSPSEGTSPPQLLAALPDAFDGWEVVTSDDLYTFSSQLQTTHLAQRTYTRTQSGGLVQLTVYLAYWPPGQAPVSLVASHSPDACWPGSGWEERPGTVHRVALPVAGEPLPEAEHRAFHLGDYPQEVWYWHLFEGEPVRTGDIRSPRKLLSLAWHYGFRKEGSQLFVRISSNRPWADFAHDPLMAELRSRLARLGL